MSAIIKTINNLDELLSLKPANDSEINDAEKELNIKFSTEYREYLKTYGAITANGIELTGIVDSKRINVVDVTKQERELNTGDFNDMYVIENLGFDGIIIWQNSKGEIFESNYSSKPKKIASSLNEYICNKN